MLQNILNKNNKPDRPFGCIYILTYLHQFGGNLVWATRTWVCFDKSRTAYKINLACAYILMDIYDLKNVFI